LTETKTTAGLSSTPIRWTSFNCYKRPDSMKSLQEIAATLQGYDPSALPASGVLDFLSELVAPVQAIEDLPLFSALDRVLAQDIVSPISVPPHDNSAMDGYAFNSAELSAGPAIALKVVGTAYAGKAWNGWVNPGECVKIMTGAIMPTGLDTVIPLEFVAVQNNEVHWAADAVKPGDNRRFKGEDLMQGLPALRKGQRLNPAALGLLGSALGVALHACMLA
jgi:molybdopterin molybdotransferase